MSTNVLVSSMPPYFSWVLDGVLAISAYPYHHTHLRYLVENRIHTVISVSPEEEPPFHTKPDLKVIRMNISQLQAPSLQECQQFVSYVERAKRRNESVLVHDLKGKGRAATLIACYLLKLWQVPADYIINHLRLIRPASIETSEQEDIIKKYHDTVANDFEGRYSRTQQPSFWDNKTVHLGENYDSLLATLPAESMKYSVYNSGDPLTNAELQQNGEPYPLHVISQDYQMA